MKTLNEYSQIVNNLQAEIEAYQVKPTKACSARIRKLSLQLGKNGTNLRKALVAADKAK